MSVDSIGENVVDVQTIQSHNSRRPLSVRIVGIDQKGKDLPPSHPNFDRSKIPDSQFIELLLFEILELKASLTRNESQIESYKQLLKSHNISPALTPITPSFSTIVDKSSEAAENIPIRSARRRKSQMLPLDASGLASASNLSIDEDVKKSSKSSVYSALSKENEPSSANSNASELDKTQTGEAQNGDLVQNSIEQPQPSVEQPQNGIEKSLHSSSDHLDKSSTQSTPTKVSQPSHNDSRISPTGRRGSGDKLVTNNQQRSVSGNSLYKSRIKLPPTLQQNQQPPRETMNVKELSVNTKSSGLPSDAFSPAEIISSYGLNSSDSRGSVSSNDRSITSIPPERAEPLKREREVKQDPPVPPPTKLAPALSGSTQPLSLPQTLLRSPAPQEHFSSGAANASPSIPSYDQGIQSSASLKYESPLNQLSQMSQRSTDVSPNNTIHSQNSNNAPSGQNNHIDTQSIASPIYSGQNPQTPIISSSHNIQGPHEHNQNQYQPIDPSRPVDYHSAQNSKGLTNISKEDSRLDGNVNYPDHTFSGTTQGNFYNPGDFEHPSENKQEIPADLSTPELIAPNTGRFPSRLHDLHNQPSQEEIQNYISSPNQHSLVSPITYHHNDYDNSILRTPVSYNYTSNDSMSAPPLKGSVQTPGSSFNVIHNNKTEPDDVTLLIKPEEFHTISIRIVSSISVNSRKSDDPNFTLSINDKATEKEMWRVRKHYSQALSFDAEIRPIVDCFGLPNLPDKQLFHSSTPAKIDARNETLQNFFNSIFVMPHIPHSVMYKICRFLSLDFVSPLDDFKSGAIKEGFLVRRYKGLGSTWKVRWCQVDGPFLEIYENPGGPLQETIKLKGAQIGKQSSDTVAEDKGYRHAFLVLEPNKSSKLSSYSKHFFCAESDQERDEWIENLMQFSENGGGSMNESMTTNSSNNYSDNTILEQSSNRYDYQEDLESNSKPYSLMDTESSHTANSQEASNTKEAKKLKKRSIFPFRYKAANTSQTHLEDEPQTPQSSYGYRDNYLGQPPSTISSQISGDPSIQLYLDQMNLDEDVTRAIFGREIAQAYELSNHEFVGRKVPSIIYRCLDFLLRTGGVYEEGIFRLSGSTSNIRQLKESFNTKFDLNLFETLIKPDMHTVAGLLKTYLRELPCPIFGLEAYNNLLTIVLAQGKNGSKEVLALMFKDYISNPANIDAIHYDACYVIFNFLRQIIANSSSNRMNLRNVCIVFVPTLNISVEILISFLVDFECIFEGGSPIPDANREKLDLQIPNF